LDIARSWTLVEVNAIVPYTSATRSLEVPSEVDLHLANFVTVERENLGVTKPTPIGFRALVGHDDFIADPGEPLELEGLEQSCVRPASFEVPRPIDSYISWAVECEVFRQMLFDEVTIARLVSAVAIANDL
jgi:hypothetical protein